MHLFKHVPLLAVLLLAAGCSLQPAYQRPAMPVAAAFPDVAADHAASGLSQRAATSIGWRDFFADARLQRLIELALKNNRDLRVAALNVEQLRAQYQIQRAALAPQVTATAGSSASRTPASATSSHTTSKLHSYSVAAATTWEIDFFGRLSSLSDAALAQYFASGYARQAAQLLLVSQVADQYLILLADDEQLALTRRTGENAAAAWQIVKLQFDNGVASELDLRLAQTTVEQAQINVASQVRARAQAENALLLLVGQTLPDDLPPAVGLDAQTLLTDIPAGLPSDLLQRRPDILQAEATLRAENASIGAARAAFFPSIKLTGSAGTSSGTLGSLFAAGSGAWAFAPAISLPIFNGGSNQASLDSARIQMDIGIAQYQKAIQTAFREVSDGLVARSTYDDQLAAQQRYIQAQQRRLELAEMLYSSGNDPYLNVLTARTDLYSARQALITARLNRMSNLVNLYRSLGGGWIERSGDDAVSGVEMEVRGS